MEKIDFQKKVAQLYLDVDETKKNISEKVNIKGFSEDIEKLFNSFDKKESLFFLNEINKFKLEVENKKKKLLSNYQDINIDEYLEEKANQYFQYTEEFIKKEPNFYDSFITIKPTWKKDYINLQKYLINIKKSYPHVKLIQEILYKSLSQENTYSNEINYGSFDIATDIKTAFKIIKEIQENYSAFIQINFLAIDPAYIPTFNKESFNKINNTNNNKINDYLYSKVIASIEKGSLSLNDSPINIMKIFLNDQFINHINYHYIDSLSGKKVTITQVAKEFIDKN